MEKKETEKSIQYLLEQTRFSHKTYLVLIQGKEDITLTSGSYIQLTGEAIPITSTHNRYLFDYEQYSKSIKQYHHIFSPKKIQNISKKSYQKFVAFIRDKLYTHILETTKPITQKYLLAFLFHDKTQLKEAYHFFLELGIAHFFVISSTHFYRIRNLFKRLCIKLLLPEWISEIFTLFMLFIIGCILWKSLVIKKVILKILCDFFFPNLDMDEQNKKLTKEAIIGILLLYDNPLYLYNVSFQYIFLISFFQIMYQSFFYQLPLYLQSVSKRLSNFFLLLPLLFARQQQIQLFLFVYLLFFSFVGRILGYLLILSLTIPFLNSWVEYIFLLFSQGLNYMELTMIIIHIPWYFLVNTFLYYLAFFSFLDFFDIKSWLKNVKLFSFSFSLIISVHFVNTSFESIHFLSLPYGETTIIKTKTENYMIDVGGHYLEEKNQYQVDNILLPFLKKLQIETIHHLILTHNDSDHLGAASYFLSQIPVNHIYINNQTPIEPLQSVSEKVILHVINEPYRLKYLQLFPLFTEPYVSDNNLSLVSYGVFGNKSWLFMGDIEKEGEEEFLKKYSSIKIDVLKVGHHGSNTSSTNSFLSLLKPGIAIITVQNKNIHNHPHPDVIKRLEANQIKYFETNKHGSIHYFFIGSWGFFSVE